MFFRYRFSISVFRYRIKFHTMSCLCYAAFTPDTMSCSLNTSCVHLYRLSPSTCILYRRQNCRHGYMYPLVSASRTLTDTCRRIQVDRPGYLQMATCIWCKRGLRLLVFDWIIIINSKFSTTIFHTLNNNVKIQNRLEYVESIQKYTRIIII